LGQDPSHCKRHPLPCKATFGPPPDRGSNIIITVAGQSHARAGYIGSNGTGVDFFNQFSNGSAIGVADA
jgi:hypothetical protein